MANNITKKDLVFLFEKYKDNNCIFYKNKKITYEEVFKQTKKALTYLKSNYKKKKIIFISDNSKDYLIFYLACILGNYIVLPVDPKIKRKDILKLKRKFKFNHIINNFSEKKFQNYNQNTKIDNKNSDFLVMMSSGTSAAEPKAILHSAEKLLNSACDFSKLTGYNNNTVLYHCLPMFYMAGIMNTFLSCLFAGSTIVVGKIAKFETLINFWHETKKYKVNSLHLTPSIYMSLCSLYSINQNLRDHLSNYQSIISTSSFLYPEIKSKFLKLFRRRIQSCYGITELGGPLTLESIEDVILDEESQLSVGGHLNKIKIKIKNKNKIYIKSPYLMRGYLKSFARIEKPKLQNGYFETGDCGYYDQNRLYYTGRSKELIKVGGELVSLNLIENIVLKSNLIFECAALGIKDVLSGEKIILFVVFKKKKISNKINRLFNYLKKNLKTIELPKKIVPIPEMPKTKSGKIIKREISDMYLNL